MLSKNLKFRKPERLEKYEIDGSEFDVTFDKEVAVVDERILATVNFSNPLEIPITDIKATVEDVNVNWEAYFELNGQESWQVPIVPKKQVFVFKIFGKLTVFAGTKKITWTVDAAEEDFKKKSEILVKKPFTISNVSMNSGTVIFGQDIDLDIRFTKGTDSEFRAIRALNYEFFSTNQSELF